MRYILRLESSPENCDSLIFLINITQSMKADKITNEGKKLPSLHTTQYPYLDYHRSIKKESW